MSKILSALLITLTINMFLFFGNTAVQNINPTTTFYDVSGSPLGSRIVGTGLNTSFNGSSITEQLPAASASISETGLSLIDTAASYLAWIKAAGSFILGIVTAVPDFLSQVFPSEEMSGLVTGLSALWYLYTFAIVALFFLGDKS